MEVGDIISLMLKNATMNMIFCTKEKSHAYLFILFHFILDSLPFDIRSPTFLILNIPFLRTTHLPLLISAKLLASGGQDHVFETHIYSYVPVSDIYGGA